MRFAIISDIHGNFPALTAVLEDAERNYIAFSAFRSEERRVGKEC